MEDQDLRALIFYYCREKYYNCMLNACQDGINKFRGDTSFNFYNCVALMLCQQFEQSIRELDSLKSENDFRLAVVHSYMEVYKLTGATSNDKYTKLQSRAEEYKVSATVVDLYYVAFLSFAFKQYEDAHDHINSALAIEPSNPEVLALQGWIEFYLLKIDSQYEFKPSLVFQESLKNNKRHVNSSLGLVESYMYEQNYDEAIVTLNKVVVRFPTTSLALLLKMKLNFALQNWDQCLDVIKRISVLEPDNVDVLKIKILMFICHEGKYEDAANYIQQCHERLYKIEPHNGDLLVENAQLFSRVCERNHVILTETYKMVEKALEISINNVDYMAELAYHSMLLGNLSDALRLYKSAMKLNDSSLEVLIGMSYCELLEYGINEHIKQQVSFLAELEEASKSPKLLFLKVKISPESALENLYEICERQLASLVRLPYGPEYLLYLDADFMLQVCKELLLHLPQAPALITKEKHLQKPGPIAKKVETVLNVIVKACPSIQEVKYLLSTVQFLNGDATKAKANLEQILQSPNSNFTNCYLLMAQIQLYIGQFERASQSLELGLSHNFTVRENPLYHFISGIIEKNRNNQDEAIKCFTVALQLASSPPSIAQDPITTLSLYDKATIYLELIDSHMQTGQLHEATKLIEAVVEEFRGTSEEARIIILNADQAIEKNEIQHAIDMLSKVKPNESYYIKARQKLANTLLEYRKDSKAYLQCYLDMIEIDPGPESYILLADAYLNVLEVDKALETYEKAVEINPADPVLCSNLGKAYIKTHYFAKAVSYYQDAIKLTDDMELKLQLTDLYMKLQNNDKAEMFITSEIEKEEIKLEEDLSTLQYKTKLLVMLAEIYKKNGNMLGAQKMLRNAKDYQSRVLKRLSLEQADIALGEQNILKDICMQLSEISVSLKDNEGGIALLKEAISIFPNDVTILKSLAQLYMQMNNLELCQQTCALLSKIDPDNEEASVMLADIAFRKIDFDMSSFHFTHLLGKQPTNWKALVRFIEVMRRTGELEEVLPYLQQAEAAMNKSVKNSGFSFATAMYQWYSGNLNAALRNFNNTRLDPEWGKRAIYSMIEICLNPEDEILGEQFFDVDDTEYRDSRSMALKTAERLLKELKQRSNGLDEENFKHRLLGNFLLLATKEKANIEKALEDFTTLASNDIYREEIGPIFGMASAHTMLKQTQRAKNQLKRVIKSIWTFEDAEYLERCWLLLADYYIQSSKYEVATELLQRTLQHNKACTKAYECLGFIAEKEQSYKDACNNYDNAWKFCGRSNPSTGYKLAFNFMKSKRYAEAIDTCQQVLKFHPDYPRIRRDILDRSLTHLRT